MIHKQTSVFFKIALVGAALLSVVSLKAIPALNLLRPFDSNFRPLKYSDERVFWWNIPIAGFAAHAWNTEGDKVNPLQYLNSDQDALAMVNGFPADTQAAAIAQQFNNNDDDGVRGHYTVTGDFSITPMYNVGLQTYLTPFLWLGAFIPVYRMALKNVVWDNHTRNVTAADLLTRALITDNLFGLVAQLGDGLNLGAWEKAGFGDLNLYVGYQRALQQNKPWIKCVNCGVRGGFMLPTGVKKNEDQIMSFPFGNDGSVGGILGGGIDVNFKHCVTAGIDVEFVQVFNNTRMRRIKVDPAQTDFLLLKKTMVQQEFGFFQKFNLYIQPQLSCSISLLVAYEYMKQGKNHFYVVSNDYSSTIANTDVQLLSWTTHNVLVQLKCDTATKEHSRWRPQMSVFYMHPFNGKRSVQEDQVGISIMLGF